MIFFPRVVLQNETCLDKFDVQRIPQKDQLTNDAMRFISGALPRDWDMFRCAMLYQKHCNRGFTVSIHNPHGQAPSTVTRV